MSSLWQDFRFALRLIAKRPLFALTVIFILSLGIAATSVVFSIVNGLLLRPYPYPEPDQLVRVYRNNFQSQFFETNLSLPNYVDFQQQNDVFSTLAAYRAGSFNLSGGDLPMRVRGGNASPELFALAGAETVEGRTLTPEEIGAGAPDVVVLSHGLWQRGFGLDPGVVGKTVYLDGEPFSVVGVLKPFANFPEDAELFIPIMEEPTEAARDDRPYRVFGRLMPGVGLAQARSAMSTISGRLEQSYPQANEGWQVQVTPLRESRVGEYKPLLAILWGSVSFVLLLICANVANLLLQRAVGRQKEVSVRAAMGAGRWAIIRQLLIENLLLALLGGLLGFWITRWAVGAMLRLVPIELPAYMSFAVDARVLLMLLLISGLSVILFGLIPALQITKVDLRQSLVEGGERAGGGRAQGRLRNFLVASQVALSMILLIGAGLMVRSFQQLQQVDPGFRTSSVLSFQLALPPNQYPEPSQRTGFYERLLERLESVPEVESATVASNLPFGGWSYSQATVSGQTYERPEDRPWAGIQIVSGSFFETLELPVLQGRTFTLQDSPEAPGVVVVSDTLARQYWPDRDAVGERLKLDLTGDDWLTVIGTVADAKRTDLSKAPWSDLYLPFRQLAPERLAVMLRTSADPLKVVDEVRGEIRNLDSNLPVDRIETLEQRLSNSIWIQRLNRTLFGVFALVALILAALGIYGSVAYSVSQRSHEMGVRMAMGADTREIKTLVVRQGLRLITVGLVVGLVGAIGAGLALSSLLFGVSSWDPLTYAVVILLLVGVALLACYLPARAASKTSPLVVLRYE